MESFKINIRYAQALFNIALQTHSLETVYEEMKAIALFCAKDKELTNVLKNPVINISKKIQIINEIFKGQFSGTTLEFLIFLIRKRREINLKGISFAFVELYKEYKNIKTVFLHTADEASNKLVEDEVLEKLHTYLKKTLEIEPIIKPELLGGFKLLFDDYLYDASIATRIQKLRKEFSTNPYEKKA